MIGRIGLCLLLTMMLIMAASADDRAFQSHLQKLDDEKSKVRMDAAWSLAKTGDARAIEPLIQHLEDPDRDVREWVVLSLIKIGQPSVDPLIQSLVQGSNLVRWQAAVALGRINDRQATEPLIRALRDSSDDTRYWAAIALGDLNDSKAREPLIKTLADSNASVREAAGWSLFKIVGSDSFDLLIGLLQDNNSSMRMGSASVLSRTNDHRAVQPLISALDDREGDVRAAAAASLGRLGNASAIDPLVRMLGDDSSNARDAAVKSLTQIGQPAFGALVAALDEKNNLTQSEAAQVLGDIGGHQAIEPLIKAFKKGDSSVRHNAVLSLMKIDPASITEPFMDLLQSNCSEIRADAAWALGLSGDSRAKSRLLEIMAQDEDSNVRLKASIALRQLGAKWDPVALQF